MNTTRASTEEKIFRKRCFCKAVGILHRSIVYLNPGNFTYKYMCKYVLYAGWKYCTGRQARNLPYEGQRRQHSVYIRELFCGVNSRLYAEMAPTTYMAAPPPTITGLVPLTRRLRCFKVKRCVEPSSNHLILFKH